MCLDYISVKLKARKEKRSTVLTAAIYSRKTRSWHLIEKLFLLKATFIFALKEPNNLKVPKNITKCIWSFITPFCPSSSSHTGSISQVYNTKILITLNQIICVADSVVILLNYAHLKNKRNIIWSLFRHRDLLFSFFNIMWVSKCIFFG